jgi:hypothetical protein
MIAEADKIFAVELANHTAGNKMKLGFLIRGQWQTETILLLGKERKSDQKLCQTWTPSKSSANAKNFWQRRKR